MPLTDAQHNEVLELVYSTAEVLGHELRPSAGVLIANDLEDYPIGEIRQALARCRAEIYGRLTLAAILERMPSANAHLLPNEAWALALTSTDEKETVVWTPEIAKAFGAARPVLDGGDKVGARMAFIAAYERELALAKAEGRRPEWQVSLGHDPQRRQLVLEEAVTAGRLPAPKVQHLLPPPDEPPTKQAQAQRAHVVAKLRDLINRPGQEAARKRAEAREQEERRRAELLAQAGEPVAATGRG